MSNALRFAILLSLCTGPLLAGAQVFRCTDTAGKVHFADHPCAPGQASREVKIDKHPAPPPPAPVQAGRMSPEAMEYEKARAEQRQKSAASQKRIDDAAREVRQIKLSNFNPGKCDAAHRFMAQMERRDPLLYKIDIGYIQASQVARLHCGRIFRRLAGSLRCTRIGQTLDCVHRDLRLLAISHTYLVAH